MNSAKSNNISGGVGAVLAVTGIILTAVGVNKVCEEPKVLPPLTMEAHTYLAAVQNFNANIEPQLASVALPAVVGSFYPTPAFDPTMEPFPPVTRNISALTTIALDGSILKGNTEGIVGGTVNGHSALISTGGGASGNVFKWNDPPMRELNVNLSSSSSSTSSVFTIPNLNWQTNTLVDVKCSRRVEKESSSSSSQQWFCTKEDMASICSELYGNVTKGGVWYAPWATKFPCVGDQQQQQGDEQQQPLCGQCSWNNYLTEIALVIEDGKKSADGDSFLSSSSSSFVLSPTVLSPFYPFNDTQQRFIYGAAGNVPPSFFTVSVYHRADPFIVAQNVTRGTMVFPSSSSSPIPPSPTPTPTNETTTTTTMMTAAPTTAPPSTTTMMPTTTITTNTAPEPTTAEESSEEMTTTTRTESPIVLSARPLFAAKSGDGNGLRDSGDEEDDEAHRCRGKNGLVATGVVLLAIGAILLAMFVYVRVFKLRGGDKGDNGDNYEESIATAKGDEENNVRALNQEESN